MAHKDKLCKLCLQPATSNRIQIEAFEGELLHLHFPLIFSEAPKSGSVCHDCWIKLQAFHEFYLIVEALHSSIAKQELIEIKINEVIEFKEELLERRINNASDADDISIDDLSGNDKHFVQFGTDYNNLQSGFNDNNDESFQSGNDDDDNDPDFQPETRTKKARPSNHCEDNLQSGFNDNNDESFESGNDDDNNDPDFQPEKRTKKARPSHHCEDCDITFPSTKLYEKHRRLAHSLPIRCTERPCPETFSTEEELDKHMEDCHTREKCPECSRIMYKQYIPRHIEKDHKRVLCHLCGVICLSQARLITHRRLVHKAVHCGDCDMWFDNIKLLREHRKLSHIPEEKCPICGKVFRYLFAVERHMKKHSTPKSKKDFPSQQN